MASPQKDPQKPGDTTTKDPKAPDPKANPQDPKAQDPKQQNVRVGPPPGRKGGRNPDERRFAARMLFPTSGRCGFDPITYKGPVVPRNMMKAMLVRENELRLSDAVQTAFDQCAISDSAKYTDVVEGVQKQVLREFGFSDDGASLLMFRSALSMYPNDEEIKNLAYYYKYNRSRQGELYCGAEVDLSKITLKSLDGTQSFQLSQFAVEGKPLVLIAGSIT